MVATPIIEQKLTLEEFLQQPETKPASEYSDGIYLSKTDALRRTQYFTNASRNGNQ